MSSLSRNRAFGILLTVMLCNLLLVVTASCQEYAAPETAEEWAAYGLTRYGIDPQEAEREISKAERMEPGNVNVQLARAFLEMRKGRFAESLGMAEKIRQKAPNTYEVYLLCGIDYYGLYKYELALENFTRAVQLCPGEKSAIYRWRAEIYTKLHRTDDATRDMYQYLKTRPETKETKETKETELLADYRRTAQMLVYAKEYIKADDLCKDGLQRAPGDAQLLTIRCDAWSYMDNKRKEEFTGRLELCTKYNRSDLTRLSEIAGELSPRDPDTIKSLASYLELAQKQQNNALIIKGFAAAGRACAAQKQWQQSADYFSSWMSLDNQAGEPYYERGKILQLVSQYPDAIRDFEEYLRRGGSNPLVNWHLCAIYVKQNRKLQANLYYDRLIQAVPGMKGIYTP